MESISPLQSSKAREEACDRSMPPRLSWGRSFRRPGSFPGKYRRNPSRERRNSVQKANKLIVVNASPYETRVATLESGILVEFLIERRREQNIVGNIYKGKVIRVLPGMQAAFVDIG